MTKIEQTQLRKVHFWKYLARLRSGTTCLLATLEMRGFARFEYSIIRNFQYSKFESEKKTKMRQIHVMNVQFHFSGVVQLGLSPILSDEIPRNRYE